MSKRHMLKQRVTVFYENGREVARKLASKSDREWANAQPGRSYIRVNGYQPKKGK